MAPQHPNVSNVRKNVMNIDFGGYPARIYFLPGVPADAGDIPQEPSIELEKCISTFISNNQTALKGLLDLYGGRKMDVIGVLYYAQQQGRFDQIVGRLREEYDSRFNHIPPIIQFARTDMTRFFMEVYLDLGIGTLEAIQPWREIDARGPGLIVLTKPDTQD